MTIAVRPADLVADRAEILGVLLRNLTDLAHDVRYAWLYLANPCGPARTWLACETPGGRIVGVASVFPRALWMGGRVMVGGQVGDFAVERSHRTLGPALALQRATLDPVDRGGLAFCYDCPPHALGMATFRRLGLQESCAMQRWARLLRTERQFAVRLGRGPVAAALSAAGNRVLALRRGSARRVPGLDIEPHPGRFGDEFSQLDREAGDDSAVRGRRLAAELNWRYRDDPLHTYRVLVARRQGEPVACVVYAVRGEDAYLVDFFGRPGSDALLALVEALADEARAAGLQTLQAVVADRHPGSALLRRAGFAYRDDAARVVAYASPGSKARAFFDRRPPWAVGLGDILA